MNTSIKILSFATLGLVVAVYAQTSTSINSLVDQCSQNFSPCIVAGSTLRCYDPSSSSCTPVIMADGMSVINFICPLAYNAVCLHKDVGPLCFDESKIICSGSGELIDTKTQSYIDLTPHVIQPDNTATPLAPTTASGPSVLTAPTPVTLIPPGTVPVQPPKPNIFVATPSPPATATAGSPQDGGIPILNLSVPGAVPTVSSPPVSTPAQ